VSSIHKCLTLADKKRFASNKNKLLLYRLLKINKICLEEQERHSECRKQQLSVLNTGGGGGEGELSYT